MFVSSFVFLHTWWISTWILFYWITNWKTGWGLDYCQDLRHAFVTSCRAWGIKRCVWSYSHRLCSVIWIRCRRFLLCLLWGRTAAGGQQPWSLSFMIMNSVPTKRSCVVRRKPALLLFPPWGDWRSLKERSLPLRKHIRGKVYYKSSKSFGCCRAACVTASTGCLYSSLVETWLLCCEIPSGAAWTTVSGCAL